jgi:hypothetical protein
MGLKHALKVRIALKNSKYCAATGFLKTGMNPPISECGEVPDQPSKCAHAHTHTHTHKIERGRERKREGRTGKTYTKVFNASW